jgi:hypothetical protein
MGKLSANGMMIPEKISALIIFHVITSELTNQIDHYGMASTGILPIFH